MQKNKAIITIVLMVLLLMTTGCVRGDIVLDISRSGRAELSSKLMVVSVLRDNLKPVKEKFEQDGFAVMDVKESGMEGFHAVRNFDSIADMKNLAIFKGLNIQESLVRNKPNIQIGSEANSLAGAQNPEKQPKLSVEHGLIFNTYRIDADIDLGSKSGFAAKDDNIIVKNIMSQVDLKFVLKLPTKTIKNNAYQVSEDGRTLIWRLALGEDNQIVAEAKMINLWSVGIIMILTIGGGLYIYLLDRKRRSRGILARRQITRK